MIGKNVGGEIQSVGSNGKTLGRAWQEKKKVLKQRCEMWVGMSCLSVRK